MINELQEFKSYITTPTSDTPRLQPKMLTDDFGSTGNLYGLEHLLTIIARGFIFGSFYDADKLSDDGIISDNFIATVTNILFSWLGFECANDFTGDVDAINKWNKKYPQASGWLKKYYMKHCTKKDASKRWAKIEEERTKYLLGGDYRLGAVSINNIIANALELGLLKEQCIEGIQSSFFDVVVHPDRSFRHVSLMEERHLEFGRYIITEARKKNIPLEKNYSSMITPNLYREEFWNIIKDNSVIYGIDAHSVSELQDGYREIMKIKQLEQRKRSIILK